MPTTRIVDLELDRAWTYGQDVQHGGHLLELLGQAALAGSPHPHPLATSAHFLAAPRLGPAEVQVQTLRTGRSVSTHHARLVQGGRICLDTVVTAGLLGEPGPPEHLAGRPPALPPVEQCVRSTPPPGVARNGITEQLDLRRDPGRIASPANRPELAAWVRYASGRAPDPLALLCIADALPPVTFALGRHGWVPTVQLTVHVRALPAVGWLRVAHRATLMQDGWLDEGCEIWDSEDRLVAQSVQLAGYRSA